MRRISLIVFVLFTHLSFSQKNDDGNVLLKKANEIVYSDPEQALKISEHLLHNSADGKQHLATSILLTKIHLINGNYSDAIAQMQTALNELQSTDVATIRFETYLLAAEIYAHLELFEISKPYNDEAKRSATNHPELEKKLTAFQSDKTLQRIASKETLYFSFITKGTPEQRIANFFLQQSQLDSAAIHFKNNLDIIYKNNAGAYWQMTALLDYSHYYFQKKKYPKAIDLLNESLEKGKTIHNSYLLMSIYDQLSNCYLALNDKAKFREYKQKANIAGNDNDTKMTLARNYAFEVLQKNVEEKIKTTHRAQQNWYWFLGIAGCLLLLGWLFLRWLFGTRIRHESDIISYLKLIKKSGDADKAQPTQKYGIIEKTSTKNLSIPKETEDLLLAKLEKFEAGKKYLSKEISLAQMASQFETNTKYLSEIINKYKGKNVNLYINELRINYIVGKLKNDPKYLNYKVSYLAEECGFSSHSSFSSVFKSITGITPNVFIQFLSRDIEQLHKTQMEEV